MLLSLGVGIAFALAQGDHETEKPFYRSAFFLVGLAFHFVFAFGVALLCFVLEPDWMWMYFTYRPIAPNALAAYVFCGYFAMYLLGYLLTRAVRESAGVRPAAVLLGIDIAAIAVFIGVTFHRLWYVGSNGEYFGMDVMRTLRPIRTMPHTGLFWVLLVAMPLAIGGLAVTLLLLRRHFARIEAAPAGEERAADA